MSECFDFPYHGISIKPSALSICLSALLADMSPYDVYAKSETKRLSTSGLFFAYLLALRTGRTKMASSTAERYLVNLHPGLVARSDRGRAFEVSFNGNQK